MDKFIRRAIRNLLIALLTTTVVGCGGPSVHLPEERSQHPDSLLYKPGHDVLMDTLVKFKYYQEEGQSFFQPTTIEFSPLGEYVQISWADGTNLNSSIRYQIAKMLSDEQKHGGRLITMQLIFNPNSPFQRHVSTGRATLFQKNAELVWFEVDGIKFEHLPIESQPSAKTAPEEVEESVQSFTWTTHKVRSGETLSSIALKYGVSVSELKTWNSLRTTQIRINQSLKVKV